MRSDARCAGCEKIRTRNRLTKRVEHKYTIRRVKGIMTKGIFGLAIGILLLASALPWSATSAEDAALNIPILVYHRFGPSAAGSTMVSTAAFESQMKWLSDNQYKVIPMGVLVNRLLGKGPPLPPRSVIVTVDDDHKSIHSELLPIVLRLGIPVTLFIYPSAISNASYALTWEQLQELQQTGLFDIQSHTYWHPNFRKDKMRLSSEAYEKFVEMQLVKSRTVLEKRIGSKVDLLAWPFGIYDDYLVKAAVKAGYIVAFTIDRRHVTVSESIMALPRYLMVNGDGTDGFAAIVAGRASEKAPVPDRRSNS